MTTESAPAVTLNGETLRAYYLGRASGWWAGDGYDRMEPARRHGWRPLGGWGSRGWDLGSWPLVVVYVRGPKIGQTDPGPEYADVPAPYHLMTDTEGDLDQYAFPSEALRSAALDYLFAWWGKQFGQSWAAGFDPENPATIPAKFRGPYNPATENEPA